MRDWKAAVRTWKRMDNKRHGQTRTIKVEGRTLKEKYLENQVEFTRGGGTKPKPITPKPNIKPKGIK